MNLYEKLIIAAYLHDIWKLAIRGWNFRKQKNYEVAHAQFVNDFLEDFWKEWSDIWIIASHHHWKDINAVLKWNFNKDIKFATWCVYMADNISAYERLSSNEKEDFSHIKYPLGNIFDVLKFWDKIEVNKKEWRKPVKLTEFDAIKVNWGQIEEYDNLYDEFITELEKLISLNLEVKNFNKFISQLDVLLQNYLSLVPSDTYNTQIADISLYDHSKLVVAFVIYLYEVFKDFEEKDRLYKLSTEEILILLKKDNKKVFLIWWDFPGIQKYIFDWIKKSKSLTKRLRARSFIIQLLSEAIIEYILDKFNLPRANVLINAGWKFVIFAWVENDFKKDLVKQINQEINKFLIEQYPGLRFTIFGKWYDLEDISKNKFRQVLTDIFDKLSEQKFKLYDNILLKQLLQNKDVSWKVLCKFCWLKYIDKKDGFIETSDDICENCEKEIWLWDKLVKEIKDKWIFVSYKDKNGNFIFEIGIKKNKEGKFSLVEEGQLFIKINKWDLDFDKNYEKIIWKSVNLYVPKKENRVLSFEEILKEYSKENGYLVMIKGDVDNMSLILKYWFDKNYSISRLLTFSRFLELFFGKVLNNFLEKEFNQVYTIFSGWDDFVFVMPLIDNTDDKNLVVIDFIKEFYWEFLSFTNDNPYIHFSLSFTLFKKDTPIKIVYELGENYLKQAKNFAKKKMEDVNDEKKAKQELKKYVISWIDDDHFVLFDWNEYWDYKVSWKYIDELKQFDLINLENKSSLRYKVYQTLKELKKLIENRDWSDYVNLGAKLLYLLVRNDFKKEDLKKLENFIWKIDTVDDYDLNVKYWKQLLKLALQIYKDR